MKRMVREISKREGMDPADVSRVLMAFKDLTKQSLVDGVIVDLGRDFGKLVTIETKARQFVVPSTGEKQERGPVRKVRFRPSASELRNLQPIE